MKKFDKIKEYFDSLNLDKSHFVNSNDVCTPMDCVKEMVDSIPRSFWDKKNLKILDPCAGNGNFHAYIETKTKLSNLYFNEINIKRINNLKEYFGDKINFSNKDFLVFDNNEKYDLIVANPPYAKFNGNVRVSKNHNLSRLFIEKSIELIKDGGYLLFIVPNNWMSFSDRNFLPSKLSKFQFIYLDIHGAKKYFPKVGSSFTWFLLKKVKNTKSFTVSNNYVFKDCKKLKIDEDVNFIPLYCSGLVNGVIKKTINNNTLPKYKIETSSYLHHYTKRDIIKN